MAASLRCTPERSPCMATTSSMLSSTHRESYRGDWRGRYEINRESVRVLKGCWERMQFTPVRRDLRGAHYSRCGWCCAGICRLAYTHVGASDVLSHQAHGR